MTHPETIVHSSDPVTLVGGGQATTDDLHKALSLAPACVAADGGAALAMSAGVDLQAIIGDFDSVSPEVLAHFPPDRHHRIAEQDSTDFEKALSRVEAPLILGVGLLGGRMDHQLAAMHCLAAFPDRPCILLSARDIVCLLPPKLSVTMQAGEGVSLFPLGQAQATSTGLKWPVDGLHLSPTRKIATSNQAIGPITLTSAAPNILLILPRQRLEALASALLAPRAARWPARAE